MTSPAPDVKDTVFDEDSHKLARTYAEAILGVAGREGQADAVLDELDELVTDIWNGQPRFAQVLSSPSVGEADKDRMLVKTFDGRALPTVVKFLRVLNRHGRLGIVPLIAREARTLWDRQQNRRPVIIRSAVPLDEPEQASLRERLAGLLKATPVITLEVDPSLIGGLVVQVDDDLYDASVRSHLDRLRRRLVDEKVHELQARRDAFQTA